MGFMPDLKGLTAKLEDKFSQMMAELQMIRATLDQILAELRTQRGGTP